jgi:hypothetical protein
MHESINQSINHLRGGEPNPPWLPAGVTFGTSRSCTSALACPSLILLLLLLLLLLLVQDNSKQLLHPPPVK